MAQPYEYAFGMTSFFQKEPQKNTNYKAPKKYIPEKVDVYDSNQNDKTNNLQWHCNPPTIS